MRTDRDRRVLHARDLVGRIVAVEGDDHGDYFLVYADGKRILVDCGYVGATLVEICPSRASIDAAILLRARVNFLTAEPSEADCWLLNAALHVEGRMPTHRIGAEEVQR